MQETQVWSLDQEDILEGGMETHFSILAGIISWTEEPSGLQPMGPQRVKHHWVHKYSSLIAYVSKTSPLWELGWSCLGPGPEKALNSHPSFTETKMHFWKTYTANQFSAKTDDVIQEPTDLDEHWCCFPCWDNKRKLPFSFLSLVSS